MFFLFERGGKAIFSDAMMFDEEEDEDENDKENEMGGDPERTANLIHRTLVSY